MRKPDNGVHRRPDFVAHIGEENALGLVGLERDLGRFGQIRLRGLECPLRLLARLDIAPRPHDLHGISRCVANELLLVAQPAIRAVLIEKAVFDEMHALLEDLGLLRLDPWQIVGMHVDPPEIGTFQIFLGRVAEEPLNVRADEGRREIAGCGKAVNHHRRHIEQQIEAFTDRRLRKLGFFALGNVCPRAGNLEGFASLVAHHLLPVMHPEIRAVGPADAVLDRTGVVDEHLADPNVDGLDVVRVNQAAPEIGVREIFAGRAAEQPLDTVADEGRRVIAFRRAAIDHRRGRIQQLSEMGMRGSLHFGDVFEAALFLLPNRLAERLLDEEGHAFGICRRRICAKTVQNRIGNGFRLILSGRHD